MGSFWGHVGVILKSCLGNVGAILPAPSVWMDTKTVPRQGKLPKKAPVACYLTPPETGCHLNSLAIQPSPRCDDAKVSNGPTDGLLTPVTFSPIKRQMRGFLSFWSGPRMVRRRFENQKLRETKKNGH